MIGRLRKAIRIKGKVEGDQIDGLVESLDADSRYHDRLYRVMGSRRRDERYPYRVHGLALMLPDEDATLVVSGRNISTNGCGFMNDRPLPAGTTCQVRLVDLRGEGRDVTGTIAHCRAVKGGVYEIGVKFDASIEPAEFTQIDRAAAVAGRLAAAAAE